MDCDIVVLGSSSVDFTSYAQRLPQAGETIHGSKFTTSFGGKGANQCVAAAKLGGKTALIARLGDDKWGNEYKSYLELQGVNTKYTKLTPGCDTGIAHISVSDLGENQIIIVVGANGKIIEEDVVEAEEMLNNAKVLVCQLETPVEATLTALRKFKGISILNAAPAQPCTNEELLTLPTIFCVNEVEASLISGVNVENIDGAQKAIEIFLERGCNTVIITLGADGAIFASQENSQPIFVPANKVSCVDSTGAGDAFIGTLAYLIADQKDSSLKEKIRIACAAASESVKHLGTQSSYIKDLSLIGL